MKIATLDNASMTEITAAFNEGFSDYVMAFVATAEYLTNRFRGARVSFSHSVGGWLNGDLVALLITGIDTWQGLLTAFNAATCVAPAARGNHFTTNAYEFLIPNLRESAVEQLQLEVVQENSRAISIYSRIGFKPLRGLRCFSGGPNIRSRSEIAGVSIDIPDTLDLERAELFHSHSPAWENSFAALKKNWQQHEVYRLSNDDELLGYAVVNSETGQVFSFGVHPDHRRKGLGTLLFSKINERHAMLKVNNVDDRDTGTLEFIKSCGIPHVIDQYEMQMMI